MNTALELHDTRLEEIILEGGRAILCLSSALVHQSEGLPGIDNGTCWLQKINILIEEAKLIKRPDDIPSGIDCGYFVINGKKYINMIDLPINESGEIEFVAETMYGNELHLIGKKISSEEIGELVFLEKF